MTGNRVQWFRAEAEMRRWQEQAEQKLIEFLRCMTTFATMSDVWTSLSNMQPDNSPGHVAYARKTAAMYARMEKDCEKRFDDAGYKELRLKARDDYGEFIDYVLANRRKEDAYLRAAI
jgi:hypothetical protein